MSRSALEFARRNLIVGAFAIAAALNACSSDASSPVAPEASASAAKGGGGKPGTAESVLFAGGAFDGGPDIYSMNPDGSNVRRLTTDSTSETEPDFAPGNRKFVFVRSSDGFLSELWTANADGSKQTQLTSLGTRHVPAALLAGRVEDRVRGGGRARLRDLRDQCRRDRLAADHVRTRRRQLADLDAGRFADRVPELAQRYQLDLQHDGRGAGLELLLDCSGFGCRQPAYSPDGTKIAAADDDGNVLVFDLAQNVIRRVGPPTTGSTSSHPTWTKDGTRVLFDSDRGIEGTKELYVGTPGDLDPTSIKRLTLFSPGQARTPSYSH